MHNMIHKLTLIIVSWLLLLLPGFADGPAVNSDTYNGQPVGSALSSDDAAGYVNQVVKDWMATKSSTSTTKINSSEVSALAVKIQPLGLTNLLAVYRKTAPDTMYRVNALLNQQDEIERVVVENAVSMTATSSDLDAVLGVYASRPLILDALIDHPEWDSDPRVGNFLATSLDQLNDAYKSSNLAPTRLLELAARNPGQDVQSKLDTVIGDAVSNDANYPNAHLYLNLITIQGLIPSPIVAKHLPDIWVVLSKRAKTPPGDIYNEVAVQDAFVQLQWLLQYGAPWKGNMASAAGALFADQKVKDAVLKMAQAVENGGARVLVPTAACGDKNALKKLAELSHNGGDPKPSGMDRNFGTKYLETVVCKHEGDKLAEIVNHIDDATYDSASCTWTIP